MALARKPYVILDAEILSSSVWSAAIHVRMVWITMLILCDTEGYVGAALPGIAHAAGVTNEQAADAIQHLMKPDPYSRTKQHDGRRVEEVERGYRILNFIEHLDRLSSERAKARDRVRRHRERKMKRDNSDGNVTVPPGNREEGVGSREKGVEKNEQRITDSAPTVAALVTVKAKSWTAEACEDWSEFSGGVAPGGKIGAALKPLVAKVAREKGWDEATAWSKIRPYWRKFCESDERRFGPHAFAENPRRVMEGGGKKDWYQSYLEKVEAAGGWDKYQGAAWSATKP